MAAFGDFLGDVAHLEQRRIALAFSDEGADALDADEFAFIGKFAQRPVGGHLADAELDDQLVFRRHAVFRRPFAAVDAVEDHLLDAGVKRRAIIFRQFALHLAGTLHCLFLLHEWNSPPKSTFLLHITKYLIWYHIQPLNRSWTQK